MKSLLLFVSLLALSATSVTQAVTFKFYALTSSGTAPFVPPGELFPVPGSGTSISNDWVGDPNLTYLVDGLGVTASAEYMGAPAIAMQDRESDWSDTKGAGLGVYKPYAPGTVDTSDDNIDIDEMLTLTFDKPVEITKLILRANGHNYDNWSAGATFLFNGVSTLLPIGVGYIDGSWTGTSFTFAHSGGLSSHEDGVLTHDFYVAGIVAEPIEIVPDMGTTMVLLGLAILGLVGLKRRMS